MAGARIDVLVCGLGNVRRIRWWGGFASHWCRTGEYTTGFVHGSGSKSDKKIGVVGLSLFELRRLGKVKTVSMVGTTGKKFPAIREHLRRNISATYNQLDTSVVTFPADDVERNPLAYEDAIAALAPGSLVAIFTPDDTHFAIAKRAIEHGCHVLIAKPAVKTLSEHNALLDLADKHRVLVQVEFHKRWDPIYVDARHRIRNLGNLCFFNSFMSQPKFQLETFRAWAGVSSDISYYLNSHHVDFSCWALDGLARPLSVSAVASTGIAESAPYGCKEGTEDTITLTVRWQSLSSRTVGTAAYTASWTAPRSDVHSQQRFYCLSSEGDVTVDQAHRGYTCATDSTGFASINPLYMSYAPGPDGNFAGHHGYGYKSIEACVDACIAVNEKRATLASLDKFLPTLRATLPTTVILHAGRTSLDKGGVPIHIVPTANGSFDLAFTC